MGFQFLDSSIVFVFNLMKIIILGTSVVGNETKGKLLVLGFGCCFSCGGVHENGYMDCCSSCLCSVFI